MDPWTFPLQSFFFYVYICERLSELVTFVFVFKGEKKKVRQFAFRFGMPLTSPSKWLKDSDGIILPECPHLCPGGCELFVPLFLHRTQMTNVRLSPKLISGQREKLNPFLFPFVCAVIPQYIQPNVFDNLCLILSPSDYVVFISLLVEVSVSYNSDTRMAYTYIFYRSLHLFIWCTKSNNV